MDKTKTEFKTTELNVNTALIKSKFGNSFDIISRNIFFSQKNAVLFTVDGMCDEMKITETIVQPVTDSVYTQSVSLYTQIKEYIFKGSDVKLITCIEEACEAIISGNLVMLCDGETGALSFSVQGFSKKAVSEPQSEQNERGGQEGFTDNFKDNAALLRRRMRTPDLIIEKTTVGKSSNTPLLICYMNDRVNKDLLNKVKKRVENIKLDAVLGSGFIRPFLDSRSPSLFADSGVTERPDTFAAMLCEGRIGIIVDGTPFSVIVPYLFSDYFHALDDYLAKPYYALFIRMLRIACFLLATALPGFFVAACIFHPEIMPSDIMYDIAASEGKTPFPIMIEALTIHLIYEIVREAGIRMPRTIGPAVSIVGALVIGDAAVTAGLIAAHMLIIVALTAISSSVIAKLHEPVAILRFAFIIIGGFTGLWGVMLGVGLMITDICSINTYGIPFSAPISPYSSIAQRDTITRFSWLKIGRSFNIERLKY